MTESTLPNDVTDLKKMLLEQYALIQDLNQTIEQLNQQISWFQKYFYGQKSERKKPNPEKDGPVVADIQVDATTSKKDKATNSDHNKNGRRSLPDDLPRHKIKLDLSDEQKQCTCGDKLHCIGKDISEQLELIKPKLFVKQFIRYKYSCNRCKNIVMSPMPAQPIEKGMAGPGLLAEVIVSKYDDCLPLYRQERRWERLGYVIPRSTQCDWIWQCAQLLKPIVNLMRIDLMKSSKIHTDDTTLPVLALNKAHKGHLWVYIGGDSKSPTTAIYEYTKTRQKKAPQEFLNGYKGFLQADAYGGYDHLYVSGDIIEVACMAHARRKFVDVIEYYKTESSAERVLDLIRQLYAIEKRIKQFSPQSRYYIRRREARPILKSLLRFIKRKKKKIVPNSLLDKALNYMLNHWQALCNYLLNGELEIDNNAAERAMRLPVLGRKNYLFAGSEEGAHSAAILYSLIQTCKQNNINTFDYFSDVLSRLPSALNKDLYKFLPYSWKKYRPIQSSAETS